MKLPLLLLTLITFFLLDTPLLAEEKTTTLNIQNMTCAMCPITVKKSLTKLEGVRDVLVSFDDKTAVVTYDDTQESTQSLTAATTNAGYPSTVQE